MVFEFNGDYGAVFALACLVCSALTATLAWTFTERPPESLEHVPAEALVAYRGVYWLCRLASSMFLGLALIYAYRRINGGY